MPLYNRLAAVNYATTWALTYNPMWVSDRSSDGGGGDCTNFISQALYAGGWKMVRALKWDHRAWYSGTFNYDRHNRSRTWGSAEQFTRFLAQSGRVRRCDYQDLNYGDLVQERLNGQIIHTMIVTQLISKGTGNTVCLSYHSHDTLNKPFPAVQLAAGNDATFVFWRLYDLYEEYRISVKGGKY